jgi:hypothetical protein
MDFNMVHLRGPLRGPRPIHAPLRRLQLAGGQQNRNGIHGELRPRRSPHTGPTAIPVLIADHQSDRTLVISRLAKAFQPPPGASRRWQRTHQRKVFRLRRRESSMTSVTPAPSQIAPCIARSIWLLLSCFWVPFCDYREFLRARRRFRKSIMMPPAAIQIPACISVSVICVLLCVLPHGFHQGEEVLKDL